jgi:glucose-6-phosphate 1-epimerase
MSFTYTAFQGQPAIALQLPSGDRAMLLLHGAQLLSWCSADGREHLYLSPAAGLDGQQAIRGGVPICFPQFNQRGPLLKHGFARHLPWQLVEQQDEQISLLLRDGPVTRAFWPQAFEARLTLSLAPNQLRLSLQLSNTGTDSWAFTAALHSYLRVADVEQARLQGLQGAARWDALRDADTVQEGPPVFGVEFDSVYQAPVQPLQLHSGPAGRLEIAQSASWPQTVVWNPGPDLSRKLGDLPDDGWRQMLCVEAACIDAPYVLAAGESWQGWQQLTWLA